MYIKSAGGGLKHQMRAHLFGYSFHLLTPEPSGRPEKRRVGGGGNILFYGFCWFFFPTIYSICHSQVQMKITNFYLKLSSKY